MPKAVIKITNSFKFETFFKSLTKNFFYYFRIEIFKYELYLIQNKMGGFKFTTFVMYIILLITFLGLINMIFGLHGFALIVEFLIHQDKL